MLLLPVSERFANTQEILGKAAVLEDLVTAPTVNRNLSKYVLKPSYCFSYYHEATTATLPLIQVLVLVCCSLIFVLAVFSFLFLRYCR